MSNQDLFDKRLGIFSINEEIIRKDPQLAYSILNTVIPVRAEYMFLTGNIEYSALSYNFDIVEEGYIINRYKAIIENNKFVRWEHVDG